MEDFGARDWDVDNFCRAEVKRCDLFIGIIGHRFGGAPKGSKKSYTQREYGAAREAKKPILLFLAPDDFPIPAGIRGGTRLPTSIARISPAGRGARPQSAFTPEARRRAGFMTWRATSGSGYRTGGASIPRRRPRIRKARKKELLKCCAAGAGPTVHGASAFRVASGSFQRTVTTIWGFVAPGNGPAGDRGRAEALQSGPPAVYNRSRGHSVAAPVRCGH